jgi:ribosomal protein S18 acetylase RimI-like enzyme
MRRDLDVPLPAAELPAGLEIRPVAESDLRRIWDADAEAFQDHWNSAQRTEADFEGWLAEPELDTGLWRVAWAGSDVAGSVQCSIWATENEMLGLRRGWLDHVSVRRPWRRRGLAAALIVDALSGLQVAGMAEAALGVDAENPTGAVALYERLGFRATRTTLNYARQF